MGEAVFKIRSETCRTKAQFCQNLYIFIYDKEGKLAGPTQILPVNVRGPALILKTGEVKGRGHFVGPASNRCTSFSFHGYQMVRPTNSYEMANGKFNHEKTTKILKKKNSSI